MTDVNKSKVVEFLKEVKNGNLRSEVIQEPITDNIILELSVGPFEYGYIHLRLIIQHDEIPVKNGIYYQRLYKYDEKYQQLHKQIVDIIEAENETGVENAHSWESKIPTNIEQHPSIPDRFKNDEVLFFEDQIQLRDDVTMEEALLTNRSEDHSK